MDDKGIANVKKVKTAVGELEAKKRGESHGVEFMPFSLRWK